MKAKNDYEHQLTQNIRAKVRELKSQGVAGMSVYKLLILTSAPFPSLDGALRGPNAKCDYAEMFERIARRDFSRFVVD